MKSNFFVGKCFAAAIGAVVVATLLVGTVHADETIAYWKFDSSDITFDSSGNGYTLMTQGGVTVDTDDYDGVGTDSQGSISFDGISGCAATLSAINLSSYDAVRLSFYIQNNSSVVGVAMEHTDHFWVNNGGIAVLPNYPAENAGTTQWSSAPYEFGAADPLNTQTGVWEQFTIEYWPTAPAMSDVIKVYKNGVFQAESTLDPSQSPTWDETTRNASDTLADGILYFGARDLGNSPYGTNYFGGKLDEVKLESFTPHVPSTPLPLVPLTNVVAEWTFDDAGNPWADSSGNENDLSNVGGVTQSGTTPTGTGSSAYFDNSVTAKLKSAETLDLSELRHIQLSWSQLATSDELDVLFEHSAHATAGNPGGFYASMNEVEPGAGIIAMTDGVASSYNLNKYEHAHGAENTTWEEMVVDINLDATSSDLVTTVYCNGVVVSTYYDYDVPGGSITNGLAPAALLNDYFNLGGRDGWDNLNFTGYIDNFTITTEPSGDPDIAGDANHDGKVDGSDVTILAGNWQVGVDGVTKATWEMGDFNGDKKVDGSDVTILAGNWQTGVTATAAAVPEPSTLVLLLGGLLCLLINRRR